MDEIAEDAAGAGTVWLEVSVWPGLFAGRLGPNEQVVSTLAQAADAAGARHGVGVVLVLAANRGQGPAEPWRSPGWPPTSPARA